MKADTSELFAYMRMEIIEKGRNNLYAHEVNNNASLKTHYKKK